MYGLHVLVIELMVMVEMMISVVMLMVSMVVILEAGERGGNNGGLSDG